MTVDSGDKAAMARLPAEARIKLAIGGQFVELEVQKDRIGELEAQLAASHAEIASLRNQLAARAAASGGAGAAEPAPPPPRD